MSVRIISRMARPAASSAAELMRKPEARRDTEVDRRLYVKLRDRAAFIAIKLWLIIKPISFILLD